MPTKRADDDEGGQGAARRPIPGWIAPVFIVTMMNAPTASARREIAADGLAGTKNDAIQTNSRTAASTVNSVGNLIFLDPDCTQGVAGAGQSASRAIPRSIPAGTVGAER